MHGFFSWLWSDFGTAHVYLKSEAAIKKVLVDRYSRGRYTLCTKMMMAPTENAAKKQFYTGLERTGVGFFDFHTIGTNHRL